MMGGSSNLENTISPYLKAIISSDMETAKKLYFFLSPIFFFIHALYQYSRKAWRIAVTATGIYCERIVRNLFQELDRRFSTQIYQEMKDSPFENKNGRLKKELEERHFWLADDLFSLLKRMYFWRSRTGPHDVPPPEQIQARISVEQCLPAYIDYLCALVFLGNDLKQDYNTFVSFFNNLTQTRVALVFGEEVERITAIDFIKEILYREGFFEGEKVLGEVMEAIGKRRYTFSKSSVANALRDLSRGKDAILTRKEVSGQFRYSQRIPPNKYFKLTI